ncbi:MAG TPA: TolC family protein [Candidatus Dormibacteraeota bacterium]|nr:TolC family protein [Candidatus Dormibacteraeota bacterium]
MKRLFLWPVILLLPATFAFAQERKAAIPPTSTATGALPLLTLDQAKALAVQNRPLLRAEIYTAEAAKRVTGEARSAYYPHVYGSATGVKSENGSRVTAGGLNNPIIYSRFADGLTASQLVTDFGRTHNLVRSADYSAKAQQKNADATRADVILQVDQSYFAALQAQAVLRVAQQAVRDRQLVADRVQVLAKNKLKSSLDVSFADVDLSKAKLLLAQAQNNVTAAFAELSFSLGDSTPQTYQLQDEAVPPAPSADVSRLVSQAFANRPEVASSRFEVESAKAYTKAERDLFLPTLSAVGTAGLTPYRQAPLMSRYAAAGFNLNIPIFTGTLYAERHGEAVYRQRASEQRFNELKDKIARDVRVAALNANTAYQRLDLTKQLLQEAGLALNLAQSRYNLGLSSIVELSQAQLNQTQAQIDEASAKYDYQIAIDGLDYQLGILN